MSVILYYPHTRHLLACTIQSLGWKGQALPSLCLEAHATKCTVTMPQLEKAGQLPRGWVPFDKDLFYTAAQAVAQQKPSAKAACMPFLLFPLCWCRCRCRPLKASQYLHFLICLLQGPPAVVAGLEDAARRKWAARADLRPSIEAALHLQGVPLHGGSAWAHVQTGPFIAACSERCAFLGAWCFFPCRCLCTA
jgi:hypothetical protein